MDLPCVTKENPTVHGRIVGTVRCDPYYDTTCPSILWKAGWTTKALVCLGTFAKGRVVEMSWLDIEVVESIERAIELCKEE